MLGSLDDGGVPIDITSRSISSPSLIQYFFEPILSWSLWQKDSSTHMLSAQSIIVHDSVYSTDTTSRYYTFMIHWKGDILSCLSYDCMFKWYVNNFIKDDIWMRVDSFHTKTSIITMYHYQDLSVYFISWRENKTPETICWPPIERAILLETFCCRQKYICISKLEQNIQLDGIQVTYRQCYVYTVV